MKVNAFELGLLNFLKAMAPVAGTLFIHNQRSVAIFNASDGLFGAVVDHMNEQQAAEQAKAPAEVAK